MFKKLLKGFVGGIAGCVFGAVFSFPVTILAMICGIGGSAMVTVILAASGVIVGDLVSLTLMGILPATVVVYSSFNNAAKFAYACYNLDFTVGLSVAFRYRQRPFSRSTDVNYTWRDLRAIVATLNEGDYVPLLNPLAGINATVKLELANMKELPKIKLLEEKELAHYQKIISTDEKEELENYLSFFAEDSICAITLEPIKELKDPITIEKKAFYTHTFDRASLARHISEQGNSAFNPQNRDRLDDENIRIYRGHPAWIMNFIGKVREKISFCAVSVVAIQGDVISPSAQIQTPLRTEELWEKRISFFNKQPAHPAPEIKIQEGRRFSH